MLLNLRRLAECHEVKGDPGTAVKLWQEFLDETYGPPAAPAHFEGVYHLARTYVRMNRYNEARKLIRKTEADFMGFGKDEELNKKLDELKKKINY